MTDRGPKFLEAARRSTALLSSILDAIPPETPTDDALAATLLTFLVMCHESGFTKEDAVESVRAQWSAGERLRDGIVASATKVGGA